MRASTIEPLKSHNVNASNISNTTSFVQSIVSPMYQQIEQLKSRLQTQQDEHENELQGLIIKQSNLLVQRDKEVKEFVNGLLTQITELKSQGSNLSSELKVVKVSNENLKRKLAEKSNQSENHFSSFLATSKQELDKKLKEIDMKYDTIFATQYIKTDISSTEQGILFENKIKLMYEEMFTKDKLIASLSSHQQSLLEENSHLLQKFKHEKETLIERIDEVENMSFAKHMLWSIEAEIESVRRINEERIDDLSKEYSDLLASLKEELVNSQYLVAKLKEDCSALRIENQIKAQENSRLKKMADDANEKCLNSLGKYDELIMSNKIISKENELLKDNLRSLNVNVGNFLNIKLDENIIKEEVEKFHHETIVQLKNNLGKAEAEIDEIKPALKTLQEKYEGLLSDNMQKKQLVVELGSENKRIKFEINDLKTKVKEYEESSLVDKTKITEAEKRLSSLSSEVLELKPYKNEFSRISLAHEKLASSHENLKKEYDFMESRLSLTNAEHMKEVSKYKAQSAEFERLSQKAEKCKDYCF